jgi:acyl dehydratase
MAASYVVSHEQITDPEQLTRLVGREVGPTAWRLIEQERVDAFGEVALDRHWIHNDPEAAARGPFGTPIAHAHLTLALMPWFGRALVGFEDGEASLFYGYDRVRFPAPVPVGGRIRAHGVIRDVREAGGALQLTLEITVEIEGQNRPACVALAVWRHYAGVSSST